MKNLNLKALNIAISLILITSISQSHAQTAKVAVNSEAQNIQQLRQEVQELKELLQQLKQSNANVTTAVINPVALTSASEVMVNAPVAKVQPNSVISLGKTELTVYGNIRLDASYQAEGGSASRLYNQINTVPLEGHKESSDEFKSTLSGTRIGLDLKS